MKRYSLKVNTKKTSKSENSSTLGIDNRMLKHYNRNNTIYDIGDDGKK
jgi:hypothetical protein